MELKEYVSMYGEKLQEFLEQEYWAHLDAADSCGNDESMRKHIHQGLAIMALWTKLESLGDQKSQPSRPRFKSQYNR